MTEERKSWDFDINLWNLWGGYGKASDQYYGYLTTETKQKKERKKKRKSKVKAELRIE